MSVYQVRSPEIRLTNEVKALSYPRIKIDETLAKIKGILSHPRVDVVKIEF